MSKEKDPFEIATECIAFGVRRASRLVTGYYDHSLAKHGMRSTQFTILNALKALEDVTINELAEQLQSDRTTLTRNLTRLEKQGWIERRTGTDRRSRHVRLTRAGARKLDAAIPAWAEAQTSLADQLGKTRYQRLMTDLSDLEESCAEME
jgi:DNA-binding MarR family transcriptional regulator